MTVIGCSSAATSPRTTEPLPVEPKAPRTTADAAVVAEVDPNDPDRDTILGSLSKNDVREHGGGAGMGVALAYRSCDPLVFNLAPGRRTEIIALIDVRHPPTERLAVSSYNVFVERT